VFRLLILGKIVDPKNYVDVSRLKTPTKAPSGHFVRFEGEGTSAK
jgi:hypothetical protein